GGGADAIAWLRAINERARAPDLTLVLDVSPELAAERRRKRRGASEIYDQDELQARLCRFYQRLEQHFPGERIVHVDGAAPIEAVAARPLAEGEGGRAAGQ